MKKVLVLFLVISMVLVGCQSTTTNNTTTQQVNSFSFGNDLVFVEKNGTYQIDLEQSSAMVKEKHERLSNVFTDSSVFNDMVAVTTTTANILYQSGIMLTGAPESSSLNKSISEQQYDLKENGSVDKSRVLNIGSALSPNIEAIIELNPKLILYSDALPKSDFINNLESVGLKTHALKQSDYMDMFVLLNVINKTTNYQNQTSTNLMKEMVDTLKEANEIIAKTNNTNHKTVAILQVTESSVFINNQSSILGGVVSALGMQNVFATSENAEVNKEQLLTLDPDYIIYYSHGMGTSAIESFENELKSETSIYRELNAVKSGNAFPVASNDFIFSASVDFNIIKIIKFLAEKFYE